MDILEYRDYCLSLPFVEESTPFDETTLVFTSSVTIQEEEETERTFDKKDIALIRLAIDF